MVDASTVVIMAVKIGYKKAGLKGAFIAGIASGASILAVLTIVRNYTDVDDEVLAEKLEKISDDDELIDMMGGEFGKRIGDLIQRFSEDDSNHSMGAPADD